MSPFAFALRELRNRLNIRQADLARMVGYEQSYLSGLELGSKGPPTHEFVERLITALELPTSEADRLRKARGASERKFEIPTDSPEDTYLLCNTLHARLSQLHPLQRQAIFSILQLTDDLKSASPLPDKQGRQRFLKPSSGMAQDKDHKG